MVYVFSIKDEDNNESYYRYIRFPLKLAWAQTIINLKVKV